MLWIDSDPAKLGLARQFGSDVDDRSAGEDSVKAAKVFAGGRGCGSGNVTACTASNEPTHQAAPMCHRRGPIVLAGVVRRFDALSASC